MRKFLYTQNAFIIIIIVNIILILIIKYYIIRKNMNYNGAVPV